MDEQIVFRALTPEDVRKVLALRIAELSESLLADHKVALEVDADAGLIRIIGGAAAPLKIPPVPPFMQQLIADGGLMKHIAKGRAK